MCGCAQRNPGLVCRAANPRASSCQGWNARLYALWAQGRLVTKARPCRACSPSWWEAQVSGRKGPPAGHTPPRLSSEKMRGEFSEQVGHCSVPGVGHPVHGPASWRVSLGCLRADPWVPVALPPLHSGGLPGAWLWQREACLWDPSRKLWPLFPRQPCSCLCSAADPGGPLLRRPSLAFPELHSLSAPVSAMSTCTPPPRGWRSPGLLRPHQAC